MKKRFTSFLFALSVLVLLFATSCTREYTCQCKFTYTGAPGLPEGEVREYKIKDTAFLNIIEGNNQTKPINSYSEQDQCSNTCPTCVPDSCIPCKTLPICETKCPDGWIYYSATNFCYKVQLFTFQYIMSYNLVR